MNWKNASKDTLPQDGEEVLISVDGVNYVAVFLRADMIFSVKHKDLQIPLQDRLIYWSAIVSIKK